MQGYERQQAANYILSRLDGKEFRGLKDRLPSLIDEMMEYDQHFMRLTGVIDADGCQGDNEYDDDEAFEYIYDAWLSDHPDQPDDDMKIASLLNAYMELQYQYLCENGLAQM